VELLEALSALRTRIADPSPDDVTDRELTLFLLPALETLAGSLGYVIVNAETAFSLEAGTYRYDLPDDCDRLLWVEWSGNRLTPSSMSKWVRDGRNWRTAAAAVPTEYAVEARTLVLFPPPSAATVGQSQFLPVSYIAFAAGSAPGEGLADADWWVAIYKAAIDWWGQHPGTDQVGLARSQAMLAGNKERYQEAFLLAVQRGERPIESRVQRFRVGPRRKGYSR